MYSCTQGSCECKRKPKNCGDIITAVLFGLLLAVVGLILGIVFQAALVTLLPVIIIIAVILFVFLIAKFLMYLCQHGCD